MASAIQRARLLAAARTDRTFEEVETPQGRVLRGKCIHCKSPLLLSLQGEPLSQVTLEHILPKCHGGTDDLENLALACARCNNEKGIYKDPLSLRDPGLLALIERLRKERQARWRDLPPSVAPPPPEESPQRPPKGKKGRR